MRRVRFDESWRQLVGGDAELMYGMKPVFTGR